MEIDSRARTLVQIADGLFTAKRPWDQYQQGVMEIFHPLRADYTRTLNLGEEFGIDILDDSPVLARETLGNTIDSMLRQGDWFTIGTGDEERDEKPANARSLDTATKQLRGIIRDPRTQCDSAFKEADHDWVSAGNPVLSWEVDHGFEHLLLRAWHPRDCAWMFNEAGQCDYLCRKFEPSARDIMRRIRTKAWSGPAHSTIVKAAADEPGLKFPVLHILMRADEYYEGTGEKREAGDGKPYVSLYVDKTNQQILNKAPSRGFRYVVPRYRVLSGHAQGFSPVVINSLGNSRMLQDMARVILEQGEKSIDPPMIARQDLFRDAMNAYAGGLTIADIPEGQRLQDVFTTLNTADNFSISLELKQDVRELISEAWLLNKLFLPRLGDMRELEVATRNEEFRRAALPFFTPIEGQYHSPVLETGFELATQVGAIRSEIFTPELREQEIRFTFYSPLKEVEGQKKVAAFFTMTQVAGAAAEIDKTVASIFAWRKAAEDAVRGGGAEVDWILDEKAREEKDQEEENLEALRKAAAVASTGSQVVTDMSAATLAAQQAGLA